jgi:hypothetical protein
VNCPQNDIRATIIVSSLLLAMSHSVLAYAQEAQPLRQSSVTPGTTTVQPLTLRDASRNDRWIGLGVRDIRWAPDGSVVGVASRKFRRLRSIVFQPVR